MVSAPAFLDASQSGEDASMIRPATSMLALTLGAFALVSCNDAPTQPAAVPDRPFAPEFAWASNSWTSRAPLPSPPPEQGREGHAVGVAKNSAGESILYVLGGIDPNTSNDVTIAEAYNYATNTWTTKSGRFAGSQTNGVGVIGGKLYVSGGRGAFTGETRSIRPSLFVYDPVADAVTQLADMPRPTADGVTGVIGGKLYVLTGSCGNCAEFISRRFYRYDPATNTWAFLAWVPRAHRNGVGGVINGRFYVAGGVDGNSITTNLDLYDPTTNRWTARAPLPTAVTQAGGAVLNNKLYVVGGFDSSRMVYAYDPVTNTWQTKASMPTARHGLAAVTITAFGNSKILAVGGDGGSDPKAPAANEAYKP